MTEILELRDGELVLARVIPASLAWRKGLNFFSKETEFIQVGTWGYDSGKELKAHVHNKVVREVVLTQEVIFVKSGRIKSVIYNVSEDKVAEITLEAGDIIVLINGGHGYEILDDSTEILEIKNGPYLGAEVDRRRI